jgi:hypothetical protein
VSMTMSVTTLRMITCRFFGESFSQSTFSAKAGQCRLCELPSAVRAPLRLHRCPPATLTG